MKLEPLYLHGVSIDYTNHRGERRVRRIAPLRMAFGSTAWHPKPQWLLEAHDIDRGEVRFFAMVDIHSWTPQST